MKIFILNHCSHNKGDNSVLYYLIECIKLVSKEKFNLSISCSDGRKPFWLAGLADIFYWPGGRLFKRANAAFFTNAVSRLRFLFMRKIAYKIFLWLFACRYDAVAKVFCSIFFGKLLIKEINSADIIICTGGHHISNVLEKNCINPQLVSLAVSVLYTKHPILWSQSIGPLSGCTNFVKNAISRIFNSCAQIYVRDDLSAKCVEQLSDTIPVNAPDTVFLSTKLFTRADIEKKYVVCAVYTAGIKDVAYLSKYLLAWVKLCNTLVARGFSVTFVPMQYKGAGGDERPFLKSVVEKCNSANIGYVDNDYDPKATLELFNNASYVIGHKTHSILYGLALKRPTIAIAYHDKAKYFMNMFGFGEYVFDDVIGNEEAISAMINDETSEFQDKYHQSDKKCDLLADVLLENMKLSLGYYL